MIIYVTSYNIGLHYNSTPLYMLVNKDFKTNEYIHKTNIFHATTTKGVE